MSMSLELKWLISAFGVSSDPDLHQSCLMIQTTYVPMLLLYSRCAEGMIADVLNHNSDKDTESF